MAKGWTLGRVCTIEGCGRKHYGKGLCQMHYARWAKHGDPSVALTAHSAVTDPRVRFWRQVEQTPYCWLWVGGCSDSGYGQFFLPPDRNVRAHRWAWEQEHGPLAEGVVLHHECHVRRCVRPSHLVALDARAHRAAHGQEDLTHCHHGHALTPENLDGAGHCRQCARERNRAYDARRRERTNP